RPLCRAVPAPAPDRGAGGDLTRPADKRAVRRAETPSDSIHAEERVTAYDAELLRRLWGFIRPYRRTFWLSIAILPVISALMLVQPYLLKIAIDRYVETGDVAGLTRLALLFAPAVGAGFVALYYQYYWTMVVAQKSLADLRVALFSHLERLPQRFFDRNPVGRLVTRLTTDVDVLTEMFASGAMTVFMDGLTLVGIVAIMLWIDWR